MPELMLCFGCRLRFDLPATSSAFSVQNLCLFDYHITFFVGGELRSDMTCTTFNINVAASPVGFVPEFNCCGINFCRQTNPNFAWKIQLYGYKKMGNFELNTDIFSAAKYVFV